MPWAHLHAASRDGNGPPSLYAVEEPLLNRVVVQRAIDVHGADAGPVDATLLQQLLRVQLALQGRSEKIGIMSMLCNGLIAAG